jgi:hypothetical protein
MEDPKRLEIPNLESSPGSPSSTHHGGCPTILFDFFLPPPLVMKQMDPDQPSKVDHCSKCPDV